MPLVWQATGRASDPVQRAELFGPYWAAIRPDRDHGGWTWAIFHVRDGREPVVVGLAYDERDAKQAVVDWVRPRAPRSLARRFRSFVRHLR